MATSRRRRLDASLAHAARRARRQHPAAGGRRRCRHADRGRRPRLARGRLRLSRSTDVRVGAGAAARHAGLRHRLRLPGPLRLRRSRAVDAAPPRRPRPSASRATLRLGRDDDDDAGLLSVCLRPGACRLPRARRRGARGGAQPRAVASSSIRGGNPAARAAVARCRRGPRSHGSARGLRDRLHVRLPHADGGGLPRVDGHVRPRGGHPGGQRAAHAGADRPAARARAAGPPSFHRRRASRCISAHPTSRRARRRGGRGMRCRPRSRLRAASGRADRLGLAPRAGGARQPGIRRFGDVNVPAGRRLTRGACGHPGQPRSLRSSLRSATRCRGR